MLKGKRTYIADILLVLTALQAIIPQLTVLNQTASAIVIGVFGLAVAYFRNKA